MSDSVLTVGTTLTHPLHGSGCVTRADGGRVTITMPDPVRDHGGEPSAIFNDVASRMKHNSSLGMSVTITEEKLLESEQWRLAPSREVIRECLGSIPRQSHSNPRRMQVLDAERPYYTMQDVVEFVSCDVDPDDLVGLTHRLSQGVSMSIILALYPLSERDTVYRRSNRVRSIKNRLGRGAWSDHVYPQMPEELRGYLCDLIADLSAFHALANPGGDGSVTAIVELIELRGLLEQVPVNRIHSVLQKTVKGLQARKDRNEFSASNSRKPA